MSSIVHNQIDTIFSQQTFKWQLDSTNLSENLFEHIRKALVMALQQWRLDYGIMEILMLLGTFLAIFFFLVFKLRKSQNTVAVEAARNAELNRVKELIADTGIPVNKERGLTYKVRAPDAEVEPYTPEESDAVRQFLVSANNLQNILDCHISAAHRQTRSEFEETLSTARGVISQLKKLSSHYSFLAFTNLQEIEKVIAEYEQRMQSIYLKEKPDSLFVAIIDTETTGLLEEDEPISVGVILIEVSETTGEVYREVFSYYGLREPGVPIHKDAQAIHGISIEELRGKRFDMTVLSRLVYSADLLIAHNASFDKRMLARVMPGILERKWACSLYGLSYEWPRVTRGGASLDAITKALGIARPWPHNALDDCRALLAALVSIRSPGPESAGLAILIGASAKRRAADEKRVVEISSLKSMIEMKLAEAKAHEQKEPQVALAFYQDALGKVSAFAALEDELSPHRRTSSSLALRILDRVTLLLCKAGRATEARDLVAQSLNDYPEMSSRKSFEIIQKRFGKTLMRTSYPS